MIESLTILTSDEWCFSAGAVTGPFMTPDEAKSLIDSAPMGVSSEPHDERFFAEGRFAFEWMDRMKNGEHTMASERNLDEPDPAQLYCWLKGFYERSLETKNADHSAVD